LASVFSRATFVSTSLVSIQVLSSGHNYSLTAVQLQFDYDFRLCQLLAKVMSQLSRSCNHCFNAVYIFRKRWWLLS